MVETPDGGSDLDKTISTRLDGETDSDAETHLQALAVLIDADLSDTERLPTPSPRSWPPCSPS